MTIMNYQSIKYKTLFSLDVLNYFKEKWSNQIKEFYMASLIG